MKTRFVALSIDGNTQQEQRHEINQRNGGGLGYIVRCSCGWSFRVPRQNALARAAKVRAAIAAHLRDAFDAAFSK